MSLYADRIARDDELAEHRKEWAAQLHDLAGAIEAFAEAMDEDDQILGQISGQGIANHLTALPLHIRELFIEHLSDEAARGYRADRLYIESMDAA